MNRLLAESIILDVGLDPKDEIVNFVFNACHMWSERHPERANNILDPFIKEHVWCVQGPNEMMDMCHNTHAVFDDFQIIVHEVVSSGSLDIEAKISCRFEAVGKWSRDYLGLPANGKRLSFPGLFLWTVKKHKIVDSWIYQSYVEAPNLGAVLLQEGHRRSLSE